MKEVEIHLSGGQKVSFKVEEVDIRTATETSDDGSIKAGDIVGYDFKPVDGARLEVIYFKPQDIIGVLIWKA